MLRERACPICRADVQPAERNAGFPFCSPRCKTIDFGSWLDGRYRLGTEESGSAADPDDVDSSSS
jgi:endogenous inhibitor of DNA gyrase (YacG/DUF329 family)